MQKELSKITTNILSPRSGERRLIRNINKLVKFYNKLLKGFAVEDLQKQKETSTYKGVALDPQGAANCLLDVHRTTKFLRGIDKAVKALQQNFEGKKIHIIYAGTGPLATLVLPLCSVWDFNSVKITFLDIHKTSLDCVKYIIAKLGYENFVNEYICCDAAKYKHPQNEPIHLVVSETMTAALYKEAQVTIAHNLGLQLIDGGILIPEEIKISAALINPSLEFKATNKKKFFLKEKQTDLNKFRIALGGVYSLKLGNIQKNKRQLNEESFEMPEKLGAAKIYLPDNIKPSYSLMLCTEIKIFDDIIIYEYESGLTFPIHFSLNENFNDLESVEFFYDLSEVPSFKYLSKIKRNVK